MTSRRYALALIAVAMIMFVGTIATNLIVDPEAVFGSPFFTTHDNPNLRYRRYQTYNKEASQVEGLIFASSRGYVIDPELVSKYVPQQGKFMNLWMFFGGMTDFEPFLQYIVRDKARRGEKIRTVLLLLDLDFIGWQPWTNSDIASFLPPELSTESAGRFWWRYLTAVQPRSWNDTIKASIRSAAPTASQLPLASVVRAGVIAAPPHTPGFETLVNDVKEVGLPRAAPLGQLAGVVANSRDRRVANSTRPDLRRQVQLFARMVAVCRDHGIHLVVMTSPILRAHADSFLEGDIQHNLDLVARIAPIWDFTTQGDIADRTDLWIDDSHFRRPVVEMMLRRIFGDDDANAAKFGRLVPQAAAP